MICPQCKAEYREGFTLCADCEVPLVAELPALAAAPRGRFDGGTTEPQDQALAEDPFCAFWQGEDARIHAELCTVLEEAGIPYKTVRREDHVFRLSTTSALKIGVPFSLYGKAEAAVKEAFGSDEEDSPTMPLLGAPEAEISHSEIQKTENRSRAGFDPRQFFPEDAVTEVYSGKEFLTADFLVQSFQANEIHCRWEKESERQRLFVLEQDADRAREIVREVTEAIPPA
jgi:hypothetical protein